LKAKRRSRVGKGRKKDQIRRWKKEMAYRSKKKKGGGGKRLSPRGDGESKGSRKVRSFFHLLNNETKAASREIDYRSWF